MPRKAGPQTPKQKQAQKSALAKKILDAALEDSDQEGGEDSRWEWIYETTLKNGKISTTKDRSKSQTEKKVGFIKREDGLECRIGDCVMLTAPGNNSDWVGMIKGFTGQDHDGDELAEFLWFSTEKEIHNKLKKRTDFLPVRLNAIV
jgi:origin recognition complex subunit 1